MKYKTLLENVESQLKKVLDSLDSKWVKVSFILSKLDLPIDLKIKRTQFSVDSFIKLYLYKRIKGITTYPNLINKLDEQDINNLGFIESLPKKRTFNEFLQKRLTKENLNLLDYIAEKILSIATKNNVILDIELVKDTLTKKKKEIDHKNKKFKEAIKIIKKLIYPKINLPIKHNAKFTTKDLLDVLVHVAYSHDFCNNGSKTFSELYPDREVPSGDTLLYHFNKLKAKDEVEQTFNDIFDVIFSFTKRQYSLLNRRKMDIAIDIHNIPYYGDKSDPYVIGGKQDRGTNHFFKFISCSIVTAGKRFILDAFPMHQFDNLEDLVDKLIKRAKSKINVRYVYLDRGFDNHLIIKVLKQNNVKYLMPKIKTYTVKQWYDKSEDCKSRIIRDFKIKDETTTLILVDDEESIKRAFSTNIKVSEPIAHYLFNLYKARWGIETGYRCLDHDFKPRTTSKNYNIRLFYFLFSVCLYNLWILVNICVSLSLYRRLKNKPVITTKLFSIVLYRAYIDPG